MVSLILLLFLIEQCIGVQYRVLMKTSIRSLMILVLRYKVKSCDSQKNICTTYHCKLSKGRIPAPVVYTDL